MTAPAIDSRRLEELLDYCVDFSKRMLEAHASFYPFGAVIRSDGTFSSIAYDGGQEHPEAQEVFLGLPAALKRQFANREIVAAAIAVDANIPAKYQPDFPDGVRIGMECAGYSRFFYLPYRLSKKTGLAGLFGSKPKLECREFITVDVPPSLTAP